MRIGIYLRTSTDQQREKRTIESQRQELVPFVERAGHTLVDTYADDGLSGTLDPDDRPELSRLLRDVALGRMDAVVVVAQDRLSRPNELADMVRWKATFKRAGVKVVTPHQTLDLESPEDDFLSDLYGILAKRERRVILDRCMRGRRRIAREGRNPGFEAPFGWRWNKEAKAFQIDETEARVFRHVFRLCIDENKGLGAISDELNRLLAVEGIGWKPRRGMHWAKSTIRKVLEQRSTGCVIFNTRRVTSKRIGGKLRQEIVEQRPESDWIKIPLPRIVTPERYADARRVLDGRATFSPRMRRGQYLLSGLVHCGECGAKAPGEWTAGRRYHVCYRVRKVRDGRSCPLPWLRADDLEAVVWSEVKRVLSDPALVRRAVEAALPPAPADPDAEMAHLQRLLDRKAGEVTKLDRAYRQGKLSEQRWQDQVGEVEAEKRLLQRNIDDLGNAAETARARAEQVVRIIQDAHAVDFDKATWDDRRKLLVALCHAEGCGVYVFADRRVEVRGVLRPTGEVGQRSGLPIKMSASA